MAAKIAALCVPMVLAVAGCRDDPASPGGTGDQPPAVSSTVPNGAATDVALNTGIVITFSEPVAVAAAWFAIACDTSGTHTAAVGGGPQHFTLAPDVDFAANEDCAISLAASQVTDQDPDDPPDTMALDYAWTFTTAAGEVVPSVVSTIPASAATGVALDAGIAITFNEPVDVAAPWFGIVCATSGTHTATVSGGPQAYMLDPAADFATSESCTITVMASQVTDQDSDDPPDNVAADYAWTFTTAASAAMQSPRRAAAR